VDQDVLIPRVETEEIVKLVLNFCKKNKRLITADVGCGCGCLGITLALGLTESQIFLSDISDAALGVARKNADGISNVKFLKSDLLENYPNDVFFDVVVANLPYIPTERIPHLQSSVKDFEPHVALDGGPSGTTIINKFLQQLSTHLKSNGFAVLEIDNTHRLKDFYKITRKKMEIKKDQFGRNRFLVIQ